ncbi:NAD(P)-dependent alcohol dehydrogenase [Rubrobacter naiadicus]|uniref:NAD(P)-dependent alcohol dehydrogenase n=1 Tax=Rubrobacter naiadicus TaxID=1392641 RepID=UPI0023611517|nr:NAD(P)-dependent alcohol dehydrogenase [Rubrobacter naiadicus]
MRDGNQAAVMYAPHDVRLEERPMPEPGPKEVLVEIRSVGVCGSDIHYYEHGRIGSHVVEKPLVLGHESSGVIVGLGEGVTKHEIGERVALEPGVPDGTCRECRAGRYNLCPNVRFFATPPIDGAFASYVTIHEDFAFRLPDSLSDDAGALMEPLSVGIWACRKAGVEAGDHVLITGAGPIGLLAMQVALANGATEVTITDVVPERLELAKKTGATRAINVSEEPLEGSGLEVDALIECSGNERALAGGIRCLRPSGTAVVVGMGPGEEATVPLALIQNREIWLTGTFRYANTYPAAIELAATGRVDVEAIVTGHYGLAETEAALQAPRRDPANVKPVVRPGA